MIQKGTLPTTGQIELVIDEEQLKMLERGLINEIRTSAIISFPDQPTVSKKKIYFTINFSHSPGTHQSITQTVSSNSTFLNNNTVTGLSRARNYMVDQLITRNSWLLFGELEGENRIPMIILLSISLNIATYSFKKRDEELKEFNPHLN